jgi:hypothetical protein
MNYSKTIGFSLSKNYQSVKYDITYGEEALEGETYEQLVGRVNARCNELIEDSKNNAIMQFKEAKKEFDKS